MLGDETRLDLRNVTRIRAGKMPTEKILFRTQADRHTHSDEVQEAWTRCYTGSETIHKWTACGGEDKRELGYVVSAFVESPERIQTTKRIIALWCSLQAFAFLWLKKALLANPLLASIGTVHIEGFRCERSKQI